MVRKGRWLGVALVLTGCGPGDTVPGSETMTQEAAPAAAVTDPDTSTATALLLERGVRAMQEGRITRPMGDSALDLFVTLHGREPDNAGVETALVELRPYVLLAAERAIAAEDLDDAERLVGALAMFDPDAAALPRLREALAGARERLAAAGHEPGGRGPAVEPEAAEPSIAGIPPDGTPPAIAAAATAPTRIAAAAVRPVGETADRTGAIAAAGSQNTPVAPTAPDAIRSGPSASNDVARPVPSALAPAPARAPPPAPAPATVADDAPPVLVRDAAPEYPLSAMRRGLSGRVRLEFTVRPDGGIADVAVLSSSPEGVFDQAAIAAARRWRFEPRSAPATSVRELRFDAPRR